MMENTEDKRKKSDVDIIIITFSFHTTNLKVQEVLIVLYSSTTSVLFYTLLLKPMHWLHFHKLSSGLCMWRAANI